MFRFLVLYCKSWGFRFGSVQYDFVKICGFVSDCDYVNFMRPTQCAS